LNHAQRYSLLILLQRGPAPKAVCIYVFQLFVLHVRCMAQPKAVSDSS
jgi:hypothetical protein